MSMDQVVRDKNDPIEEEENEVTPLTLFLAMDDDSSHQLHKQTNNTTSFFVFISLSSLSLRRSTNTGALLHW